TLVKWLKNEGDSVKNGDMLAEVDTDKATMELECFFDGTLLKLFAPAGSPLATGEPLRAVGKAGAEVQPPEETSEAPPPPAADAPASDKDRTGEPTAAKNEVQAQPVEASKAHAPHAQEPASAPATRAEGDRIRISPLARKLAAEKGIDPSALQGSGPGGRIVRADILAAEKSGTGKAGAKKGGAAIPTGPSLFAKGPVQEDKAVPASNMRATIAKRLLEAKTQIPHFYLEIEIDAEPLLSLRAQLNAGLEAEGVKLSVNDFILKASAEALRR